MDQKLYKVTFSISPQCSPESRYLKRGHNCYKIQTREFYTGETTNGIIKINIYTMNKCLYYKKCITTAMNV